MPDGVDFKIDGLEALNKRLKALDEDLQYKGGRFALRKAAQVVRDEAREGAKRLDDPSTAADISANIVERWSTRAWRRGKFMMFRVGVLGGAGGNATADSLSGNPGGDTRHWRYLEFGTEKTPATPFMRKAAGAAAGRAFAEFVSQYSKKLDRLLK